MTHTSTLARRLRNAALFTPAALALACCGAASAKTLVFCSEGSPENFYATRQHDSYSRAGVKRPRAAK